MFKRRSSKDINTKIGYDHVNGKASRNANAPASSNSSSNAPVASIPPGLQNETSFSSTSSYRRTTGMPSPDELGETNSNANSTPTGPSPLAALKPLPPRGYELQQEQLPPPQQQRPALSNGAVSTTSPGSGGSSSRAPVSSKSKSASSKEVVTVAPAEPPSKSLVIGEGVLFEGSTEGCAAAVVGGRFVGKAKSRRLEITRSGKMEGTAYAETAEIAGTFEGNLTVTKALKICSTGRFKGDVSFGSIVVENGGKLEGKVNFGGCRDPVPENSDGPPPAAAAPKKKTNVAAAAAAARKAPSSSAPVAPAKSNVPLPLRASAVAGLKPVEDGRQSPE